MIYLLEDLQKTDTCGVSVEQYRDGLFSRKIVKQHIILIKDQPDQAQVNPSITVWSNQNKTPCTLIFINRLYVC